MHYRSILSALFTAAFFALLLGYPDAVFARTPKGQVAASSVTTFLSEIAARRHCPRDEVVWLNLPTGIYHEKGMRWYGRTKHGAFVCKSEAEAAGDRDTRNGQ